MLVFIITADEKADICGDIFQIIDDLLCANGNFTHRYTCSRSDGHFQDTLFAFAFDIWRGEIFFDFSKFFKPHLVAVSVCDKHVLDSSKGGTVFFFEANDDVIFFAIFLVFAIAVAVDVVTEEATNLRSGKGMAGKFVRIEGNLEFSLVFVPADFDVLCAGYFMGTTGNVLSKQRFSELSDTVV